MKTQVYSLFFSGQGSLPAGSKLEVGKKSKIFFTWVKHVMLCTSLICETLFLWTLFLRFIGFTTSVFYQALQVQVELLLQKQVSLHSPYWLTHKSPLSICGTNKLYTKIHWTHSICMNLETRAGRSPTFQDPGTPLVGLARTRVPVSPIEKVLSWRVLWCGLITASLTRTRGYPSTPLQLYLKLHVIEVSKKSLGIAWTGA